MHVDKTLGIYFLWTKWLDIDILSSSLLKKGKDYRRTDTKNGKGIQNKDKQHSIITEIAVTKELELLLIMLHWKKWIIDLKMIIRYYL